MTSIPSIPVQATYEQKPTHYIAPHLATSTPFYPPPKKISSAKFSETGKYGELTTANNKTQHINVKLQHSKSIKCSKVPKGPKIKLRIVQKCFTTKLMIKQ